MRRLVSISILLTLAACGGDDGGAIDAGMGDDAGATADARPSVDASGDPSFPIPGGRFRILERIFASGASVPTISGSIAATPWTGFHEIAAEEGFCRLLTYEQGFCRGCDGVCRSDDTCAPWPVYLSAGQVDATGLTGEVEIALAEVNQTYYAVDLPADLFDDDAEITLSAAGDQVPAFALTAGGVRPIEPDLAGAESDELHLVDGGDVVLSWDDSEPGARVRLTLKGENDGHGLPLNTIIECDAPDTGSITVPRALVEAFPEKARTEICDGHDCPASTLERYRRDATTVDGIDIDLWVASEVSFYLVHEFL